MSNYLFDSVVFDLDGVITQTALVHAAAWKEAFDEYLKLRQERDGEAFREFTHDNDYLPFVDGKPRYEGVKSFLESRNIDIPYGTPQDEPGKETVCGIGNKKNEKFRKVLKEKGAQLYDSSIEFIKHLKSEGLKVGVASSSKNCKLILESVGMPDLFETRVDGEVSAKLRLQGKPEPDIFVKAARNMDTYPKSSVVVEDATSGVLAGRNGGFGLVLGVARKDNSNDLLKYGADIAVEDLRDININAVEKWFSKRPRDLFKMWDNPLESFDLFTEAGVDSAKIKVNPSFFVPAKASFDTDKKPVFFLDYDGTLTPIVDRPDLAVLSGQMRNTVEKLSKKFTVAVVSGRQREDVEKLVGINGLFYAGSHGFDIVGCGKKMMHPEVEKTIPLIQQLVEKFERDFKNIEGILVENKKISFAVHYRLVKDENVPHIEEVVDRTVSKHEVLRVLKGKKVFEILPAIDWDKGMAVRWIMKALNINWQENSIIYIGDDTTDEDAFRVVRTRGTGVLVSDELQSSAAEFIVSGPDRVKELFKRVIASN